ncbi:MAG: hypothetical protein LBG81_04610, partial [Coriobacteriaceae bacterium]|nr:hypothetical protein [Coriobacteriaceae bacterium]
MNAEAKKKRRLPATGGFWDSLAPLLLAAGALLTTAGFVLSFTVAPLVLGAEVNGVELIGDSMVGNQLLLSQKIFYFHMPVAVVSMAALAFTAFYGIRFLMTKEARFDTCARVATEISLVFILCT